MIIFRPPNCPDYYYDIITRCHQYSLQNRMNIKELIVRLTEILNQYEVNADSYKISEL